MKIKNLAENVHAEHSVRQILEDRGFEIWKHPSGNSNDFPDVGASIDLDGITVNLHIEVKSSKDTTMGQIRNWVYKDGVFSATKITSPNTELLLDIVNSNPEASERANKILKGLRRYFSRKVTELSQSCLLVIKDVKDRNERLNKFISNYDGTYHILSKTSSEYGHMVLEHYRDKYDPRPGVNILMFVANRQMFFVDMPDLPSKAILRKVSKSLGSDGMIPFFPEDFVTTVECRVQPSTLEGRGQVRLDTIIRLRASGLGKFTGPILR